MIDYDLYKALYQHEQYIKTLKNVLSCTCCSIQLIEKKKIKYKNFNKVLEVFMKQNKKKNWQEYLNCCDYIEIKNKNWWFFCTECSNSIKFKKMSHFNVLNKINVLLCHQYVFVLDNLTLIKKSLITLQHCYSKIIKLILQNYQYLKSHITVITQDSSNLFTILFSQELHLSKYIKIC